MDCLYWAERNAQSRQNDGLVSMILPLASVMNIDSSVLSMAFLDNRNLSSTRCRSVISRISCKVRDDKVSYMLRNNTISSITFSLARKSFFPLRMPTSVTKSRCDISCSIDNSSSGRLPLPVIFPFSAVSFPAPAYFRLCNRPNSSTQCCYYPVRWYVATPDN